MIELEFKLEVSTKYQFEVILRAFEVV